MFLVGFILALLGGFFSIWQDKTDNKLASILGSFLFTVGAILLVVGACLGTLNMMDNTWNPAGIDDWAVFELADDDCAAVAEAADTIERTIEDDRESRAWSNLILWPIGTAYVDPISDDEIRTRVIEVCDAADFPLPD